MRWQRDFRFLGRKTDMTTSNRARTSWTMSTYQAVESVVPARREVVGAGIGPGLARRASKMAATKPQLVAQRTTRKVVAVQHGEAIIISNNLPYIVKLEHGHSQQAPAGVVAVSIAEVELN